MAIWTSVTSNLVDTQTYVAATHALGSNVYAVTWRPSSPYGGALLSWGLGDTEWTQVAGSIPVDDMAISPSAVFGDTIYACESAGDLWKWNKVDDWVYVAHMPGTERPAKLYEYHGKLYALGTALFTGGVFVYRLFELDEAGATWVVKSQNMTIKLNDMVYYSETDRLYVADDSGNLYEWNDINTLASVAPSYNGVAVGISELKEFDSHIFAVNASGQLLQWNDVDELDLMANTLSNYITQNVNHLLAVLDSKLYFNAYSVTHPLHANLLKYNAISGIWELMLADAYANGSIVAYGDYIYSAYSGRLYRADLSTVYAETSKLQLINVVQTKTDIQTYSEIGKIQVINVIQTESDTYIPNPLAGIGSINPLQIALLQGRI